MSQPPSPPVHSLFNEILTHIFRYYVSPSNDLAGRYFPPALRYSGVCRRWRSLALQDSVLWTVIDVNVSPSSERSRRNLQDYVHAILQRSKTQRLQVRIAASAPWICWSTVSLLQSAQDRWATLQVTTHLPLLFTTIFGLSQIPMWTSLVSIEVDLKLQGNTGMLLDLRGLPGLQEYREWTGLGVCYILLPWPTLKRFYLHIRAPCHRVACDIDDGPALQLCCIEVFNTWDRRPPGFILPEPRSLFRNVKQLKLVNCSPMLPYFEHAQLEYLDVNINLHLNEAMIPVLRDLFSSSRLSLHELRLRWYGHNRPVWDKEDVVLQGVAELQGLEIFHLETHNKTIILSDETGQLSLSQCSSDAVGGWISRFAAGSDGTPCPLLRHWEWLVMIHDHGTRTGYAPDWCTITDIWQSTWASRRLLHHCSLEINIEGQIKRFSVP